ncbi:MAG: hypothetical protein ACRDRO_01070, partial [Pseudonocardiaceae bacterium]
TGGVTSYSQQTASFSMGRTPRRSVGTRRTRSTSRVTICQQALSTAQLRGLGDRVVLQQAACAVPLLLADLATLSTAEHPTIGQEANAA